MSSNKKTIQMSNNKYSLFSKLSVDSNSSDEEPVPEPTPPKEEKKEVEKPKTVVSVQPTQKNNDTNDGEWVSVGSHKKKKKNNKFNTFGTKKSFSSNRKRNDSESEEEEKPIQVVKPKVEKQTETEKENESDEEELNIPDGEYKFQNTWFVWVHEVDSKDWSSKSYKIIHIIEKLSDFWEFFNNTHKLNQWKFNFFIMKQNSHPTWEHSTNRNGGTCSIRIDVSQSIDIIEQLAILLVNESLTEEINDINGISFAAKGNWSVSKIWNRDNKNNISNQMPSYLRKLYPSISIKYKENIPEY
jgi:hypothetical protein